MTIANFITVLLAGVFSNNFVLSNFSGVELANTGTNSFKTATVYSAVILGVSLLSSTTMCICNAVLKFYGLMNISFILTIFVVAMYVQISEYVLKKVYPILLKQVKYFVPIMAGTLMLFLLGSLGRTYTFIQMIFLIIFDCVGVWLALLLIAGIRRNSITNQTKETYKGTVMSLIIVFVLAIVWTAF